MRTQRIYVDTSVIGGCFDDQFLQSSRLFFDRVRTGEIILLVTSVVTDELLGAREEIRNVIELLPENCVERVQLTAEIEALAEAYLAAGVVRPSSWADATHVAAATVARADAIVSWNFKHILRLDRIKGYNRVNWERGYGVLTIVSPPALVGDGPQSEEEV